MRNLWDAFFVYFHSMEVRLSAAASLRGAKGGARRSARRSMAITISRITSHGAAATR
jgi:hypothetical protein